MKKFILFLNITFSIISYNGNSQDINIKYVEQASYSRIYDYAIDEISNKIYYVASTKKAGSLAKFEHRLMCVNASNGAILSIGDTISLPDKYSQVTAIVFINNQIFIGGNNIADSASNNLGYGFIYKLNISTGKIDASWNHNIFGSSYTAIWEIKSMVADASKLYITGEFFDIGIFSISLDISTGIQIATSPIFENQDFKKLYSTSNELFGLADNSLFVFNKSNFAVPQQLALGNHIGQTSDFLIDNDTIYVSGKFVNTLAGKKNISCLRFNSGVLQPWYFIDSNCVNLSQITTTISKYNNKVIAGGMLENKYCATANIFYANQIFTDSLMFFDGIARNGFPIYSNDFRKFKVLKNKLFLLSNQKKYFPGGGTLMSDSTSIGSYCLKPSKPQSFTTSKSSVCAGDKNVVFSVPITGITNTYNWAYSGSGASIIGNGNSVTINFSNSATSGTLSVSAVTECGSISDPLFLVITVNPLPNVYAGNDTSLNCNAKQIWLHANSTTNPVSFAWTLPNNTIQNADSIYTSLNGTFILQAIHTTTGCKNYDTLQVTYDTISPNINNVNSSYIISSCNSKGLIVNALTSNPLDSIFWTGHNTSTNPAALTATAGDSVGNNYFVYAIAKNGCKDTVHVNVKNTAPEPYLIIPSNIPVNNFGYFLWDTLTCLKDSILFNFTVSTPNGIAIIYPPSPSKDSFPNNTYVKTPGLYIVKVRDTITGCRATESKIFYIDNQTTLPQLSNLTSNPLLTCSNSTTILNASTGSINATINWTNSNFISLGNPAIVNQQGNYYVTVHDTVNGCKRIDTTFVDYKNILLLNSSTDTTICNGSSAIIFSAPIAGNPTYNYSWSNSAGNVSSTTVHPTDTTSYIITITDSKNCIGVDTITVNVPSLISDSTIVFAPCDLQNPNGEIQVYAKGGVPPFNYSINNGLFQKNNIFKNLNFGNYTITIKDTLNCIYSYSISITNQNQLPKADFIVSTTMMQADTFVVVDISNPRPDSIYWTFPSSVNVINNNMFAPIIISSDTGAVQVSMETHLGRCVSNLTKTVQFIKPDTLAPSLKGNGIESIIVYPNPNSGQFSVEVKLFKKQTFGVYVLNAQGIELKRSVFSESNYGLSNFNLGNPTPGTYFIKVIAEFDSNSKTFTITQ